MNKNLPKVEEPHSNWAKILFYMYDKKGEVTAGDFNKKGSWYYVGYNANSRLSELDKLGFVKHIGYKVKEVNRVTFLSKIKSIFGFIKEAQKIKKRVKVHTYIITPEGRVRAKYLANKL